MFLTVLITLVCMLIHLQPLVLINVLNTLISMLIHYPNHAYWSVLTAITPTMSLVRVFRTAPHRTSQILSHFNALLGASKSTYPSPTVFRGNAKEAVSIILSMEI